MSDRGSTDPERSDSSPLPGQVKFNNRLPEEAVTRGDDGLFRDADGDPFAGWVWLGRDGFWYGQRKGAEDVG